MAKLTPNILARTLYQLTVDKKGKELDKVLEQFLSYLKQKNKLSLVPRVIRSYSQVYDQQEFHLEVSATTAHKLTTAQKETLEKIIYKKYKPKELTITNQIDQQVGGGIKLRIGDTIIDQTIAGAVGQLREYLIQHI